MGVSTAMTDRQLLEAISNQIGAMNERIDSINERMGSMDERIDSMNERMDSMGNQIGQLVQHVAEVRRSNVRLEADIRALDSKIDKNTEFLACKIAHFVDHFSIEQARDRKRFEEERHLRIHTQRNIEQRLDALEQRMDRMDAASS